MSHYHECIKTSLLHCYHNTYASKIEKYNLADEMYIQTANTIEIFKWCLHSQRLSVFSIVQTLLANWSFCLEEIIENKFMEMKGPEKHLWR